MQKQGTTRHWPHYTTTKRAIATSPFRPTGSARRPDCLRTRKREMAKTRNGQVGKHSDGGSPPTLRSLRVFSPACGIFRVLKQSDFVAFRGAPCLRVSALIRKK